MIGDNRLGDPIGTHRNVNVREGTGTRPPRKVIAKVSMWRFLPVQIEGGNVTLPP